MNPRPVSGPNGPTRSCRRTRTCSGPGSEMWRTRCAPGRASSALFAFLIVGSMVVAGCSRGREPGPYEVRFIGSVRLQRTGDRALVPSYEVGRPVGLRFEPRPGPEHRCNPFAGGTLHLEFLAPDQSRPLVLDLGATGETFLPAGDGFVLPRVPSSPPTPEGTGAPAFRLPDLPGAWTLEVTWHCAGAHRSVQTRHPFQVHRNPIREPGNDAFWQRVARIEELPPEERLGAYRARLEEARTDQARFWIIRALCQTARGVGRYEEAEAAAGQWANLSARAGFPSDAVLAWNAAHEAARATGDLDRALAYLDRSMAAARRLGYDARLPETWYSRAELLDRSGRPVQAIEAARKARKEARAQGKTWFATAADLKELELLQAMGHHRIVNTRLETYVSRPARLPHIANNVGWLILRGVEAGMPFQNRQEEALRRAEAAFEEALTGFRAMGSVADEANAVANLAEVAFLRGDLAEARRLVTRARTLAPARDDVLHPFLVWLDAEILRAQGDVAAAGRAYARLHELALELQSADYAGRAAFGTGSVLAAQGDLEAAVAAFDEALEWIQEDAAVRSPLHEAAVLANRSRWEEAAVRTRLALGRTVEALEVVERGAWARRQSLVRSARRDRLDPAVQEEVAKLQHTLDRLDREILRLQDLPPTRTVRARLREQEITRQTRWAELEMKLGGNRPGPPPPLDLETLSRQAPDHTVVLRPVSFPDLLVVWIVTSGHVQVRQVPVARARLETLAIQFARSCRTGRPDPEVGTTLATLLLGEFRTHPPQQLVVTTEGPLRRLPWVALPTSDGPLLDRTTCRHRQSLLPVQTSDSGSRTGLENATTTSATTLRHALVVADPTRDLPLSAAEGVRVAQLVAQRFQNTTLLQHDEATRAALERALAIADLFHFAGHGVTDPLNPYLSHLRLAHGERLSLMDIQALALHHPLVFLNACGAGEVADEGGGVLGLADGFAAAGARTVVAGRWDVPDEVGSRVAIGFYQALTEPGVSDVAEALARALRAVRQESDGRPGLDSAVWSAYLALEGTR